MNRWLAILLIVSSPFSYANSVESRMTVLESEIKKLVDVDCSDLAEKGQGQAAVACEDWQERELKEKRKELADLRSGYSSSQISTEQRAGEITGDANR